MSENPAQIRLYIYISSECLTPEQMSAELKVDFDECHRQGEPRGKYAQNEQWWEQNKRFWDENKWILREIADSTYGEAYDELSVTLDRLLTRVEGSSEVFKQLASNGNGKLVVVIQSDGYPGMGLASEILRRISALSLSMDFDLYCQEECVRTHVD